jgi:hypothetical protein
MYKMTHSTRLEILASLWSQTKDEINNIKGLKEYQKHKLKDRALEFYDEQHTPFTKS